MIFPSVSFLERSPKLVNSLVNKALTFAIAYGFVSQQRNGNYKLTTKGHNLAERIKIVGDLMTSELTSLGDLSKKLTEGKIKELADLWRTNNASN